MAGYLTGKDATEFFRRRLAAYAERLLAEYRQGGSRQPKQVPAQRRKASSPRSSSSRSS